MGFFSFAFEHYKLDWRSGPRLMITEQSYLLSKDKWTIMLILYSTFCVNNKEGRDLVRVVQGVYCSNERKLSKGKFRVTVRKYALSLRFSRLCKSSKGNAGNPIC